MKRLFVIALVLSLFASPALCQDSWGNINQPIDRPEEWQDFVANSAFALGETMPYAEDSDLLIAQYGQYPSLDGSTVCVPMAMEFARQHLDLPEDDLAGFVSFSTTHYAYERLIGKRPNPTVTIASKNIMMNPETPVNLFLGTAPSDEERAMAEAAGVELVLVPVCYDAFVFLVNAGNPVDGLTSEQIRRIYEGSITRWSDVGGAENLPIFAYQRAKNSGSQTAMEQMVMRGRALAAASGNYVTDGMGELVQIVGDYDNGISSIGYSYLYYVNVLYKSGAIKTLAVDGMYPDAVNLRTGAYPFGACYYAVYRADDAQAARFADWLVSDAGQKSIAQAGYMPYREVK